MRTRGVGVLIQIVNGLIVLYNKLEYVQACQHSSG